MAFAPPTNNESTNFYSLPIFVRDAIYELVLSVPGTLYLYLDGPSQAHVFAPDRPRQWTALLSVNRQIHTEAAAVLYRCNTFAFLDQGHAQHTLFQCFCKTIGPPNAAAMARICIDFPMVQRDMVGFSIGDDGLESIRLICDHCLNIISLEFTINESEKRKLGFIVGAETDTAIEALLQIQGELAALPCLRTVKVMVYGGRLPPSIAMAMRSLDWNIRPRQRTEC